jgi:hypothetical protein
MATHRRPVYEPVPAELLVFDPANWPGSEGYVPGSNGLEWDSPIERWKKARRAYSNAHPDSALGSVLDQLRFERWTRRMS